MNILLPYHHTLRRVMHKPARKTLRRKRILRGKETTHSTTTIIDSLSLWNVLQDFSKSIERMLPPQHFKL
ncbi:MAG: hypothetical protein U0Y96_08515 [Candidatus Kapaibacterium sp.]